VSLAPSGASPWWHPRDVLRRFVADLVEGELTQLRRSSPGRPRPWPERLDLERDLGADSLERIQLATVLTQCLHLHESGIEDALLVHRTLGDWTDIAQAGLDRYSQHLTFRTSGSSGQPKPCQHTLASLRQETLQHAERFRGRRRVLAAVPSHHIYGFLFTVLLPQALGLASESVIDIRDRTPRWLVHGARPGDLVIGHPEYWRAVTATASRLAPDAVGVTSTAPCPDPVSEALEAAGLAALFQIYGASETGGIGWRSHHRDPYQPLAPWRWSSDVPFELQRPALPGEGGALACPDRLERVGPGHFRVVGRRDEAVQVGGINVFPAHVAAVLRRHPGVAEAAVRLMRPDEGSRLKAFIVPAAGAATTALLAGLRAWIDTELAAPARPKALTLGPQLPVGPTGKAADWELDPPAPPMPEPTTPTAPTI